MVETQSLSPEQVIAMIASSFQYGFYTAAPDSDPIIVRQKCDDSMAELADELLRDFYPQNYMH